MRQLSWGICAAVLLAMGIVCGQPPTCVTTIVVQNASGTVQIPDPPAMKCSPDEQMTVHVENQDMSAGYRVQISGIDCKAAPGRGRNPTKGFVGAAVELTASGTPGAKKDLVSTTPPQKPSIRSKPEVDNLNCGSASQTDFHYKYVIRATGRGNNARAERDPDLEIST
jgi:hypothetical protein